MTTPLSAPISLEESPTAASPRISILNVKFSPNLGDGVIAECLEFGLLREIPYARVASLDIGGREVFGDSGSLTGTSLRPAAILDTWLPGSAAKIRRFLEPELVRVRYAAVWREKLKPCDAIIIGGGHLFSDVGGYFPNRLAIALDAAPAGRSVFVYGVGVAGSWSPSATQTVSHALARHRLRNVAVRDARSLHLWSRTFGAYPAGLCSDPGLLASTAYAAVSGAQERSAARVVGIGVAGATDLNAHADGGAVVGGSIGFFTALAEQIVGTGWSVVFFTNGAEDDRAALEAVREQVREHPTLLNRVSFALYPQKPADLVRLIAGFDGLIAHRLHANIVAYSCNVPHVGLGWDPKTQSFFDHVGRSRFCISGAAASVSDVASALQAAIEEGIDPAHRAAVISAAEGDVARLAHLIRGVTGVERC